MQGAILLSFYRKYSSPYILYTHKHRNSYKIIGSIYQGGITEERISCLHYN